MSFTRVKPAGWAALEELDKTLISAIDSDHVKALDKTGDTIGATGASTVTFGAGSQLVVGSSSGGVACGGITLITGAGAEMKTAASGRITLGDNDYPTLSSAHTGRGRAVQYPIRPMDAAASGTWSAAESSTLGFYYYPAAINQSITFGIPDKWLHNGATLVSLEVWFEAAAGHAALPTSTDRPGISVRRHGPLVNGAAPAALGNLSATGVQYLTMPASAGVYNSRTHGIRYLCGQNNIIDKSQYLYSVKIFDELGANAVAGNRFFMIALAYSVTDMRFQ